MKKRKIKLFASLTSLVMVVAVMAVGIWAAQATTVGITGEVTYTAAQQVKATVTVSDISASGFTLGNVNTGIDPNPLSVSFNGNETEAAENDEKSIQLSADGNALTVSNVTEYVNLISITYKITVTNNAVDTDTGSKINVSIVAPGVHNENATTAGGFSIVSSGDVALTEGTSNTWTTSADTGLPAGDDCVLTITFYFNANESITTPQSLASSVALTVPA